ncbi:MAG: HEAT repeat domain-containing protein [Pyrinomonadaceae bacterium]|nr:HEAT repeat domain-containing protein [Pyrinomonadaceae bacterium]
MHALCLLSFALSLASVTHAQEADVAHEDVSVVMRDLTNRDPLVRQRAAEELARLAATDQRRLLEGYHLQEPDKRVRLALDWALYRTGKESALYSLVGALDSAKLYTQAQGYLSELEGPPPLYKFLAAGNGNTQLRLLEVFARNGDAGTLEIVKPFEASSDPKLADAARFAAREINLRLAQTPPITNIRPRQAGQVQPSTP